jgi:hypothetical protein
LGASNNSAPQSAAKLKLFFVLILILDSSQNHLRLDTGFLGDANLGNVGLCFFVSNDSKQR